MECGRGTLYAPRSGSGELADPARGGLTLPSHGALPAGPDALVFAELSRFLPGTIVVSMAGDGHGRRRPEAGGRTCTLHPSAESLRSAMFGDSVVVRPRKIVG